MNIHSVEDGQFAAKISGAEDVRLTVNQVMNFDVRSGKNRLPNTSHLNLIQELYEQVLNPRGEATEDYPKRLKQAEYLEVMGDHVCGTLINRDFTPEEYNALAFAHMIAIAGHGMNTDIEKRDRKQCLPSGEPLWKL
jgi:hypothetical protein